MKFRRLHVNFVNCENVYQNRSLLEDVSPLNINPNTDLIFSQCLKWRSTLEVKLAIAPVSQLLQLLQLAVLLEDASSATFFCEFEMSGV